MQKCIVQDSLIQAQDNELRSRKALQLASDSLYHATYKDLVFTRSELKETNGRFENQVSMTIEEKKKKRRWKWLALGLAGFGVLAAVK